MTLTTASESPAGAGLAGSSALNVAVCAALSEWKREHYQPEALLQIAMNVEAQTIKVPTGLQDYRPALYGGLAALELEVDGIHRVPLDVDLRRAGPADRAVLHRRAAQLRHQQLGDHQAAHRRRPAGVRLLRAHPRHRRRRCARPWCAATGTPVGRAIDEEWDNRRRLAPGVTTPVIDDLIARARAAGRHGGEGVRRRRRRVPVLLRSSGAAAGASARRSRPAARRLLDFTFERHGLSRG